MIRHDLYQGHEQTLLSDLIELIPPRDSLCILVVFKEIEVCSVCPLSDTNDLIVNIHLLMYDLYLFIAASMAICKQRMKAIKVLHLLVTIASGESLGHRDS